MDEHITEPTPTPATPKKHKDRTLEFLLSQAVLCGMALLFLFAIKFIGGDIYNYSKAVFEKEFNTPINVNQVLDSACARQIVNAQYEQYGVGGEEDDPNVKYYENYSQAQDQVSNISSVNSMQIPVVGPVTSEFGYRIHPISNKQSFHTGIDIGASTGTDILCALSGTVSQAVHNDAGYGNYLVITHSDGVETMYAHCSKLLSDVGDTVDKGDVIAKVGSTGISTGSHLHFEIRVNSVRLNPRWYIDF